MGLGVDAMEHHGGGIRPLVGEPAGEHLEGEDAEAEDVDPLVDRFAANQFDQPRISAGLPPQGKAIDRRFNAAQFHDSTLRL